MLRSTFPFALTLKNDRINAMTSMCYQNSLTQHFTVVFGFQFIQNQQVKSHPMEFAGIMETHWPYLYASSTDRTMGRLFRTDLREKIFVLPHVTFKTYVTQIW